MAHEHHLNQNDNLFCVRLQGTEASRHAHAEVSESSRVFTTHDLHHLLRQLERSLLKLNTFARCVGQKETKINVEHMALNVNQNVFIVPVFNLQDIADQTVGAERVREVLQGLLILL